MSTTPPANPPLYALLTGPAPITIADVVARMQAIDALLPNNDGLKWFNRLYLMVTQQVDLKPPGGTWQSPAWLTHLDTIFAGLYFSAVAASLAEFSSSFLHGLRSSNRASPPASTAFSSRSPRMNAHINHDLALALDTTNADLDVTPSPTSPQFADYQSINGLLNIVMPAALTMLATDTLGVLAEDTGKVGRLLAFWDICRARSLAWDFANTLSILPDPARDAALTAQDALTGTLGRAILALR